MKSPREILLRRHRAAAPKLDVIRKEVVASLTKPSAPEGTSWRAMLLSLRWHLTALSAAWIIVLMLNADPSTSGVANAARDKAPEARQVWASLRESRKLLMQYTTDTPPIQETAAPGRRSEIEPKQMEA